uniref:Uncharacterized protein n=1 Tax=Cryptomonas curvata TaxID=233186 RepID=A0A7S0WEK6_9CRYP|mmetsp:Transcript_9933/g.21239  ORF Transcript_9933/g.21239 Transcript_9933/m.21239 type:complete len:109 (+) Transcript_9933:270-596(+)
MRMCQSTSEACALLAAAEESAARYADAVDAGAMELDVNGSVPALQSALDGLYGPERHLSSMAPPKRFYRISWESMSLRLLDRSAHTVSSTSKSGPAKSGMTRSQVLTH